MGIEYQVTKGCFIYIIQAYLLSSNHCMQEFQEYEGHPIKNETFSIAQ